MKDVQAVRALVADDFNATNQVILDQLASDVVLVNQLGHYIVSAGGKRLRPLLVLICAKALGYQGKKHHLAAAIIEFIHTATLLHDDVVDESDRRRGRETANALFGNAASVLVGDFLYSRSFQMMVQINQMSVMQLLADTTNQIAEGEVLQLMNCNDPKASEESYFEVIKRKTAILFAAACELAALLTEQHSMRRALRDYGMHLGLAFQLVDDALDYIADASEMGKNVGDDLAEGKPTLPLIYAKSQAEPDEVQLIESCIKQGGIEHLEQIQAILKRTQAIDYTLLKAREQAKLAQECLAELPASDYKKALLRLADLAVERTS